MKEIIYIQAGNLSNYIGTHFWNTQESYFTYEEGDDPIINHDISFREGQNSKGESTFCPRLLLFDQKSNFGAVTKGLYGEDREQVEEELTSQWSGDVVEYRQPPIPQSRYQTHLEAEFEDFNHPTDRHGDEHKDENTIIKYSDIRFWSDYARVSFHPRTLHRLPDPADYEDVEGDWMKGKEVFRSYDEDTDMMEESFRPFVEECDNLQGIQIINDAPTFGSFTHSFLTSFRDEFVKLPSWTFPILSDSIPGKIDVDDVRAITKAVNDALCLRSLNELSSITVPLQEPSLWEGGEWLNEVNLNRSSKYQIASILSTHIENVTLPLRLKNTEDDLSSLTSILNWRGNTRFAHLNGVLPLSSTFSETLLEKKLYDFSAAKVEVENHDKIDQDKNGYARIDVSRGFTGADREAYENWADVQKMRPHSVHAPSIPLPTSFPPIFPSSPFSSSYSHHPTPSISINAFSSLTTTSTTSTLFKSYATFIDECLIKRRDVLVDRMGLEVDEVKEVRDVLLEVVDEFVGGEGERWVEGVEGLGEDEEF